MLRKRSSRRPIRSNSQTWTWLRLSKKPPRNLRKSMIRKRPMKRKSRSSKHRAKRISSSIRFKWRKRWRSMMTNLPRRPRPKSRNCKSSSYKQRLRSTKITRRLLSWSTNSKVKSNNLRLNLRKQKIWVTHFRKLKRPKMPKQSGMKLPESLPSRNKMRLRRRLNFLMTSNISRHLISWTQNTRVFSANSPRWTLISWRKSKRSSRLRKRNGSCQCKILVSKQSCMKRKPWKT